MSSYVEENRKSGAALMVRPVRITFSTLKHIILSLTFIITLDIFEINQQHGLKQSSIESK